MADDRRPTIHPDHAAHDRFLVAADADGHLEPADRARAAELLAACPQCAALHADLRAIAAATAALPAPARPRDFFVGRADAERLRPTGWRRLAAWLAAPRSLAAPLAGSLTALGLAGLLVAALPTAGMPSVLGPVGGPAATALPREAHPGAQVDPSGKPRSAPPVRGYGAQRPDAGPLATDDLMSGGKDGRDTSAGEDGGEAASEDPDAEIALADPSPRATLAVVSGTFLIVGLGLFGLRWTGRRWPR